MTDASTNINTLTTKEIAAFTGLTTRAVLLRAKREGWLSAGNNGSRKYYLADLPADVQNRIYKIDDCSAADLAAKFSINVPPEKLSDPRVATKIRMLCECLAVPKKARGRNKRIRTIAESYGYNVGSAYRLIKRVKSGKPLFKEYKTPGVHFEDLNITLRAWNEASGRMAIEAIMGNRRNKVDNITLYQRVRAQALKNDHPVGTYESFCRLARQIKARRQGVITFRDKGIQGLKQDIMPAIRRDPTAYRPMECLVGDQHKADYYAFDSQGNVVTLELFCWLDFRTQLVWPAVAYKHYNRYTVGQALINAVRWGLPSQLYTDWGKPEESIYVDMLAQQLSGLGVRVEGVRRVRATPRHPQAKPIEGWFSWFDRQMRNDEVPGYCKRLRDSRENELQQKELNRLIKTGGLLPVPDMVEWMVGVIDGWNKHFFKNRGEDSGKSPLHIYNVETKQYPVTTLAEEVLDYIFLPLVGPRKPKISNCQVRFKHDWHGRCAYYDRALADYNGCTADVRYHPFDPSCVWIFVDGKLVCQADEWGMINPKLQDEVQTKVREQKRLVNQIRDTFRAYQPPRKPIRRINPHEREAKQLKTVRVMKTQLEKEGEQVAAAGGGNASLFREKFSIHNQRGQTETTRLRPTFRLTMNDPLPDDDY